VIVDSSALVAVLLEEPEASDLLAALVDADEVKMSVANYVECGVVVDRHTSAATRRRFDELLTVLEVELVPVSVDHARLAREAYRDFGRGSETSAALNFGDCFAYALAAATGEALLFKGDDFSATDIVPAAY